MFGMCVIFARKINVERFEPLATTEKNAKNKVVYPSFFCFFRFGYIHYFIAESVDFQCYS